MGPREYGDAFGALAARYGGGVAGVLALLRRYTWLAAIAFVVVFAGAATVAVQLVACWAFDELGVQRLELTTAPENVASQRVAERAGFTREGVLRGAQFRASRWHDVVVWSVLRGEM